ncbi:DUF922 domain-containing protein [Pedobacter sp. MW01-1-1]|uniref:DUF922 domain-containing protein n=1 Tax=Pedobacter sp. MW01-1-1 TaxID=3383027 RepID=UPI003FED64E2
MKKLIVLLVFVFGCYIHVNAQQDYVRPVQVNWESYYKGKADKNSPFLALTALTWKYSYDYTLHRNRVSIRFQNDIYVDKSRSWVKWEKIKNEEVRNALLHHEQGHVNIQFILLKEADRVMKNRSYSVKNYKTEIADLANSISNFYDTMQRNYDEETEHGSNHKMQARWDKIIQERLDAVLNP